MMLLAVSASVLFFRSRAAVPAEKGRGAKAGRSRLHLLVAGLVLLELCYVLLAVIYDFRSPAGLPLHFFDMLSITLLSPVFYLITHTLRYKTLPSFYKVVLHYLPFVAMFAVFLLDPDGRVFYLLALYVAVYYSVLLSYHALWFLRYRDVWSNYDDAYRRQHLWQLWLIVVPIQIHMLIYVYYAVMPSSESRMIYFASAIVLLVVATLSTYHDRRAPSSEAECIEQLDPASHDVSSTALPEAVKMQIAKRLKQAEQQNMHLQHEVNLDAYAQYVGTNRSYLSRYLNQELNTTFYDYLNNKRLDHAIDLMKTSRARISDVAFASGYADTSTFRRNFKKYKGLPPRRYLSANPQ